MSDEDRAINWYWLILLLGAGLYLLFAENLQDFFSP